MTKGHDDKIPAVYAEHVLAERLGYRSWDDVLDMPHLELVLRLDLMKVEAEVAEWQRKNPPPKPRR